MREMDCDGADARTSWRLPAWLLLVGQILYIAVTKFHIGGEANNHHAVFAAYAGDETWTVVHLGQFASMAVLIAGLLALIGALNIQVGAGALVRRFGAGAAVAALALYGALQAVDGVALKQAVEAWASAPAPEKAARFANAEAIRWLEWGLRSYQDFALGLALLCAALVVRMISIPLPIALLMALTAIAYFVQGWVAGVNGFSSAQSIAIVSAWALSLVWMTWLVVVARR